uniref:Uncharacterized protein n=1 Tax=Streptomyces sp. NBC_00049 TaxID=2903617 RepID=A0AAU2K1T4_9ACTN
MPDTKRPERSWTVCCRHRAAVEADGPPGRRTCRAAGEGPPASGYNLVGRPAVVAVHEGTARLLVRRETLEDYRSRDIGD